jgi:hypothetical protein
MVLKDRKDGKDATGRPLPEVHPGPGVVYGLTPEEEHEWRKWSPKVGDVVLVETAEDGIWPGKVSRGLATVFPGVHVASTPLPACIWRIESPWPD